MDDTTKLTESLAVIKKLHEVQKEIGYMQKKGRNDAQKYNFLSESQISELFKELFQKHGIVFLYSSEIEAVRPSPSTKQLVTDVQVNYQFVDVETGEYISGFAVGQGSDSTDKGVYKAITGAVKYIFMKTFLIPTGDDPENDSKETGGAATKSNIPDDFLPEIEEED